jgi:hypothetical protein
MTAAEIIDLIKNVGFPIAVAAFVVMRLEPRLDRLIDAMRDVTDVEKTHARLKKPLDEQAAHIIEHVEHDTRAIVNAVIWRDNGGRP